MDIKDNDKITTNSSNEGMQNERSINQKTLYIFDGGNHGDRNGGHLIGYGGLISVPVAQYHADI